MVNELGFDEAVKLARKIQNLASACISRCCADTPRCHRKKFPASSTRAVNFLKIPLPPVFVIFSSAASSNSSGPKFTRNLKNSAPPACPRPRQRPSASAPAPVRFRILMADAERLGNPAPPAHARLFCAQPAPDVWPLVLPGFTCGDLRMAFPPRPRSVAAAWHQHAQITFGLLQNARVERNTF